MTVTDIHSLLCSRNYYEKNGSKRFRFNSNALTIDRRALVPFDLYEENGCCYMKISTCVFLEKNLRIEWGHADGCTFHFYGKETGREVLILE